MARYLIDTDVMIDVSRRNAAAATYVDSLDDITISIITAHELIVGARNQRDADGIDSLMKTYPVQTGLDARITGRAYQLLKRHAKPDGHRGRLHACLEEPKALPDDRRSESGSADLLSSVTGRLGGCSAAGRGREERVAEISSMRVPALLP